MQVARVGGISEVTPPHTQMAGDYKTPLKSEITAAKSAEVKGRGADKPQYEDKLQAIEKELQESNISLNFSRDEKTGRLVVEMRDDTTGEIVQQLPSKVSLRLSDMLGKLQGQFIDREV